MKKMFAAALVSATFIAASPFAFAADGQGVIASVDMETRTIILEDGSTWTVADDVDIEGLAPGDTISVTYDDGTTVVTAVTKAE